jgi:uncharacterized protein (TIGR00255 family)
LIRSMTGFGRGEVSRTGMVVTAEARSVNHRHLDIALRLPRGLASIEQDLRRLVASRAERGRVDITVQLTTIVGAVPQRVRVDAALARDYVEQARAVGREVGLTDDVSLTWLLERPGVVRMEDVEPTDESAAVWPIIADAVGAALDELIVRRTTEGDALAAELRRLVGVLRAEVETIARRAPASVVRREERLRERILSILGEGRVDEGRVITEVAIWADKSDITEELARLRAHLDQFASTLDKGGAVGRPLDFLIQELGREINTAASKGDDLELSQAAIAAKGVLEKMREQVQNLE